REVVAVSREDLLDLRDHVRYDVHRLALERVDDSLNIANNARCPVDRGKRRPVGAASVSECSIPDCGNRAAGIIQSSQNGPVSPSGVIQSPVLNALNRASRTIQSRQYRTVSGARVVKGPVFDALNRRSRIIKRSEDALPLVRNPVTGKVHDVADDAGSVVDRVHHEINRDLEGVAAPALATSEETTQPALELSPLVLNPVTSDVNLPPELLA